MRRIGLLVVGFLVASTTVGRVDAANPNSSPAASTTAPGEPEDAKYALLTELILDAGGLGAYPDSDGTIVVVIPAARVSAFAIDSATRLGLRVRIEASPTTPERVAEIKERVREFAADHPR